MSSENFNVENSSTDEITNTQINKPTLSGSQKRELSESQIGTQDIYNIPEKLNQKFEADINPKTQAIFDVYNTFTKSVGPYVTHEDAEKILNSNFDNNIINKITADIKIRKEKDINSFKNEGRNINLVTDGLNSIRKSVATKGDNAELAKDLNLDNLKQNWNNIKNFVDEKDIYKLSGLDPDQKGAPDKARIALSFGVYNDKYLIQQVHDSLVYSLEKDQKNKYESLNYKGNKIHVQNYTFDDGEKRIIYKIPKEIGGNNQYQLFNKPGLDWGDVQGFYGDIPVAMAEITMGILAAEGGPLAVATATGGAGALAEFFKLKIGKDYFGVNKDYSDTEIIGEALKKGAISTAATYAMFPILNAASRTYNKLAPSLFGVLESETVPTIIRKEDYLAKKNVKDFLENYKRGINKNLESEETIANLKTLMTTSKEEGGAGMTKEQVDIFFKNTFSQSNPGTGIANLETLVKNLPQGASMKSVKGVGKEAEAAAVDLEKASIDIVKNTIGDLTGLGTKKLPVNITEADIFGKALKDAESKAATNLIRLNGFNKELQTKWGGLRDKYSIKLNPEEQNFNTVLLDFLDPVKTKSYEKANGLSKELSDLTKDIYITIPKTNTGKNIISPAKTIDDAILDIKNKSNFIKKGGLPAEESYSAQQLEKYDELITNLNVIKGQFKTGQKMSYSEIINASHTLEDLMLLSPELTKPINQLLFNLNTLKSRGISQLGPDGKKVLALTEEWVQEKTILRDNVLGKIIQNFGATRGPVAKGQALRGQDQFDILFGNSQEQIYATKYLGDMIKNEDKLIKPKADELKLHIYDKFIKDTDPSNPIKITTEQWRKKYNDSLKNIFTEEEFNSLKNLQQVKKNVDRIVTNYSNLSFNAQKTIPLLKDMNVEDITVSRLANEVFENPNVTSKQIQKFFNTLNKDQSDLIKTYYLQNVLNKNKSMSPILDKETVDGGKLFEYLSISKNEQIFSNFFGNNTTKNLKTFSAALEFMQRPSKYLGKELTGSEVDQARSLAVQTIYGPLSHENVIMKNLMFVFNGFDRKLGKELFDYDNYVEMFKNSYAFKYAPQLNDEKFLKIFNKYDAGDYQKLGVGVSSFTGGIGTQETLRGTLNENTDLPRLPIIPYLSKVAQYNPVTAAYVGVPYSLFNLKKNIKSDERTQEKLKKFKEYGNK